MKTQNNMKQPKMVYITYAREVLEPNFVTHIKRDSLMIWDNITKAVKYKDTKNIEQEALGSNKTLIFYAEAKEVK